MLMGRELTLWLPLVEHTHTQVGTSTERTLVFIMHSATPYLNANPVHISAFKPSLNSPTGLGRCEDQPHFVARMLILVCGIYKSTHTYSHTHTRRRKGDVCMGFCQISDCRGFFSIVMVNYSMRLHAPADDKECQRVMMVGVGKRGQISEEEK